ASTVIYSLSLHDALPIFVSIRWYILLHTQTVEISYFTCIKIHFLGLFYNNILVSSLGGDILRMWYITHHSSRRVESAFSVLVDRSEEHTSELQSRENLVC